MSRRIRQEIQAAHKALSWWIGFEDFVRFLENMRGEQVQARRGVAVFTRKDWEEFTYRARKKPTPTSMSKTFDRWRKAAPELVILRDKDLDEPLRELVLGIAFNVLGVATLQKVYVIDLRLVPHGVAQAQDRLQELTGAWVAMGGRVAEKPIKLREFAELRDLRPQLITQRWIPMGFPVVKRKRGRRTFYYVVPAAADHWIATQSRAGKIRKGPGQPGEPDIQAAMAQARGSVVEAARILQGRGFYIQPSRLWQRVTTAGIPVKSRRVIEPTPEEIVAAMDASDHRITRAAEALGLDSGTLSRLIDKHGLRGRFQIRAAAVQRGYRPISKADVVEAMEEFGPRTAPAAEALGIAQHYLNQLLSKHGLKRRYEEKERKLAKVEEKTESARMRAAIKRGIKDGLTQPQVIELLGMPRDRFYVRLRRYKLSSLARQLPRQKPEKIRKGAVGRTFDPQAELVPFWLAALQTLIAEHSSAWVAASLGVSRASITHWSQGTSPGYSSIEGIMGLAGARMPDWRVALLEVKAAHPTQVKAAASLGLTQGSFSKLKRGAQVPSDALLQTILEATGRPYMVPGARVPLRLRANPPWLHANRNRNPCPICIGAAILGAAGVLKARPQRR